MKITIRQLRKLILENVKDEKEKKINDMEKHKGKDVFIKDNIMKIKIKPGTTELGISLDSDLDKLMFSSKNKFIVQAQASTSIQGAERVSIPVVKKKETVNHKFINKEDTDVEIVIQPVR